MEKLPCEIEEEKIQADAEAVYAKALHIVARDGESALTRCDVISDAFEFVWGSAWLIGMSSALHDDDDDYAEALKTWRMEVLPRMRPFVVKEANDGD